MWVYMLLVSLPSAGTLGFLLWTRYNSQILSVFKLSLHL